MAVFHADAFVQPMQEPTAKPKKEKREKNRAGIVYRVFVVIGILLLAVFLWMLLQYALGRRYYQKLVQQTDFYIAQTDRSPVDVLYTLNPDTVAWLEMPGIDVALPVTTGNGTIDYCFNRFDGVRSPLGCPFFLTETDIASQAHLAIYGRNIFDGQIFGRLTQYNEEAFYQENPTFTLTDFHTTYTYRIFACYYTTSLTDIFAQGTADDATLLRQMTYSALYDTGVTPAADDCILTLVTDSTSYFAGKTRFVVHAVLESAEPVA